MKRWGTALRDGLISGSISSLTSTLALSLRGHQESRDAIAPVNAVSHWFAGADAFDDDVPSLRHTLTGYAIHHASATFWAVLFERYAGELAEQRRTVPAIWSAAGIAAVACFNDYQVVPRRLQPGYETQVSRQGLLLTYSAFGLGLLVRGWLARQRADSGDDAEPNLIESGSRGSH